MRLGAPPAAHSHCGSVGNVTFRPVFALSHWQNRRGFRPGDAGHGLSGVIGNMAGHDAVQRVHIDVPRVMLRIEQRILRVGDLGDRHPERPAHATTHRGRSSGARPSCPSRTRRRNPGQGQCTPSPRSITSEVPRVGLLPPALPGEGKSGGGQPLGLERLFGGRGLERTACGCGTPRPLPPYSPSGSSSLLANAVASSPPLPLVALLEWRRIPIAGAGHVQVDPAVQPVPRFAAHLGQTAPRDGPSPASGSADWSRRGIPSD